MEEKDICFAQMLRFFADQFLELNRDGAIEDDLNRFLRQDNNVSLNEVQEDSVKKIGAFLQRQARQLSFVRLMLQEGNFKGQFPQQTLAELKQLSSNISDKTESGDLIRMRDAHMQMKEELKKLWKRAHDMIHASGEDKTFRILFLTDLHWGSEEAQRRWKDVRRVFFDGLAKSCDGGRKKIDLVIFGGDLAFSGKRLEYDGPGGATPKEFNEFLKDLWIHLRDACGGSHPALLTVPGNHDLCRPEETPELKAKLKDHLEGGRGFRELWNSKDPQRFEMFETAFHDYLWWRKCNTDFQKELKTLNDQNYDDVGFPGDFSYKFTKNNKTLGIVGLNTAYMQLNDSDFEGHLLINSDQVHQICKSDARSWFKNNDANILVTHHPCSWLCDECQEAFTNDICIPGLVDVHLHGHMHFPKYSEVASQPGNTAKSIQGIAVSGCETYWDHKKKEKKERLNGYVIVEIMTPDSGSPELRFRPREITKDGREIPAIREIKVDENDGWTAWIRCRQT